MRRSCGLQGCCCEGGAAVAAVAASGKQQRVSGHCSCCVAFALTCMQAVLCAVTVTAAVCWPARCGMSHAACGKLLLAAVCCAGATLQYLRQQVPGMHSG